MKTAINLLYIAGALLSVFALVIAYLSHSNEIDDMIRDERQDLDY